MRIEVNRRLEALVVEESTFNVRRYIRTVATNGLYETSVSCVNEKCLRNFP
jgi:hypothetical protein